MKGERFWMFLYPQTITSLRYDWTHPAFKSTPAIDVQSFQLEKSEKWIRNYAQDVGLSYKNLIKAAKNYLESGHYYTGGDEMEGLTTSPEFWHHFEIITGLTVPDREANFFSCAC